MLWFGVYRWTNHAMVRSLPTDPAVLWFGVFRRILTHTPEACAQVSVVLPRDSDGDLDLSDPPVTRPSQQDPRRPRRRPGTGPSDKGMPCGPPRRRQPSLPLAGLPGRLLGSRPRRRPSAPPARTAAGARAVWSGSGRTGETRLGQRSARSHRTLLVCRK